MAKSTNELSDKLAIANMNIAAMRVEFERTQLLMGIATTANSIHTGLAEEVRDAALRAVLGLLNPDPILLQADNVTQFPNGQDRTPTEIQ